VAADIARDLAATRGVADQGGALQVERFEEHRQIVRVAVHVVGRSTAGSTGHGRAGRGDDAIPAFGQKHHLVLPGVGVQRPAVREDHRASRAQSL